MKKENMLSDAGNKLATQFKIYDGCITYFESYKSIIAGFNNETGDVELYNVSRYSNTMRKYLYQFLWECGRSDLSNRKKLDKAIKAGKVKVFDKSPEL